MLFISVIWLFKEAEIQQISKKITLKQIVFHQKI